MESMDLWSPKQLKRHIENLNKTKPKHTTTKPLFASKQEPRAFTWVNFQNSWKKKIKCSTLNWVGNLEEKKKIKEQCDGTHHILVVVEPTVTFMREMTNYKWVSLAHRCIHTSTEYVFS